MYEPLGICYYNAAHPIHFEEGPPPGWVTGKPLFPGLKLFVGRGEKLG